jgi:hypothetical protein
MKLSENMHQGKYFAEQNALWATSRLTEFIQELAISVITFRSVGYAGTSG